jgi:hypothetical protein
MKDKITTEGLGQTNTVWQAPPRVTLTPRNIDITANLFKTSQKKVILATLLSTLFSSNNVIAIDSKKLFFF